MSTMRAIQVSEFGNLDVLKLKDNVAIPKAADKQILIRVHAAGINPVDTYVRSGQYKALPSLPYIPGSDGAGVVEADSGKYRKGDCVYFRRCLTGSYAEFTVASTEEVFPLHHTLSFSEGAGIGVPYFTAYRALVNKCNVKPGDSVLVHGASGAVGLAACQLARSLGLRVYGTAGTESGMELVLNNGAHEVFNHKEKDYKHKIIERTGEGVDHILEMLANVNLESDMEMIKSHGKIAVIGNRGTIEITPRLLMAKESSILGVMMGLVTPLDMAETSAYLAAGQEKGWLKPHIGHEYTMDQVMKAQEEVIAHSDGSRGKIILKIT